MDGKLIDLKASELLKKFGMGSHKPGSGSAAALQAIVAAHLLRTVIQLTSDPKRHPNYSAQLHHLLSIDSEIERRLIPALERLFEDDSKQFAHVIERRMCRDEEPDPIRRKAVSEEALIALQPATELPIEIASASLELARFGIEVFDHGFKSARGDAGVAITAALAATSGCLSIIALNLLSFGSSEWTRKMRNSTSRIQTELLELQTQSQHRLSDQLLWAEQNEVLHIELQNIRTLLKGKPSLTKDEIEQLSIRLQKAIWHHRSLIWMRELNDPLKVLEPKRVLRLIGFHVDEPASLGNYALDEPGLEVAGQIDQEHGIVSVSRQFPILVRNFTFAHELGHSLLHEQAVLHRDPPIDGIRSGSDFSPEEWQADKFAAFFLMPGKLVRNIFQEVFETSPFIITPETAMSLGRRDDVLRREARNLRGLSRILAGADFYNLTQIETMAQRFNVSIEAMAIRLEELELVWFA